MFWLGTDILKIDRIERHIDRKDSFFERFYGEDERAELEKINYKAESAAGAYCAKEAFSKALGTGIVGFSLNEVQLLHYDNGAPYLKLTGRAKKIADERKLGFSVSISHDGGFALATVIAFEK